VSILVEIAEQADVPVEGVIRVLTREPVSDAVLERVLGVLDDLTPEQKRCTARGAALRAGGAARCVAAAARCR